MVLQINHREKFSPLPLREIEEEETEETTIPESNPPIKGLASKFAPAIYFVLGMLVMGVIASYGYGNKYEKLMTAIERREELMGKMEYNDKVMTDKNAEHNKFMQEMVAKNVIIRNQILSDNEMMVEAIKAANAVKETKIVSNNP